MSDIPGHEVDQVLRTAAGRRVLRTVFGGVPCVTRVITTGRVEAHRAHGVRSVVVNGFGAVTALGDDIGMTLEGYAVAARHLREPGVPPRWTRAVDGGVTSEGFVYVSTRWVDGQPLHHLEAPLDAAARRKITFTLLDILVALHRANVAYGDLKLANLVLRDDGGVALIDLDTLREVDGHTGRTALRDRSERWAAPEQLERSELWMASDLWAAARIVRSVFADEPPAEWGPALAACRNPDPLRRPTAASLRAFLRGEGAGLLDHAGDLVNLERALAEARPWTATSPGADRTDRVPERTERVPERTERGPERTERVPDRTGREPAPSGSSPPDAPPPSRAGAASGGAPSVRTPAGGGCLGFALGMGKVAAFFGALATLAVGAGVFAYQQVRRDQADDLAEALLVAMKAHKIDARLNGASERARLATAAEEAWEVAETPRTCALRSLTMVWAQGWHTTGDWSPTDFATAQAAVQDARCDAQPEAALARATLYAGACRRRDPTTPTLEDCAAAISAIGSFYATLPPGEAWHWMRVEGAWQEVRARSSTAARYARIGSAEVASVVAAGSARCDEALSAWLGFAPVNGPELVDECMVLAGLGHDVARYLAYADQRFKALPTDRNKRRATLAKGYAYAGLDCTDTRLSWSSRGLSVKGAPWCVALGHAARNCRDEATAIVTQHGAADATHPWMALTQALSTRVGPCLE